MTEAPLHLFEGFGIEIEYMIVDAASLDVRPIADKLLLAVGADQDAEVERGDFAWSNELALHVIEFKTNGPAATLAGLAAGFQQQVNDARMLLEPFGASLLPGGMHPWMDPFSELRLWPHEHNAVYQAFDRIFDCRGHGWANLQSTHINLPFASDEEFARLHAAIRAVLPILPAVAASSPVQDGRAAGVVDARLRAYRDNAARVPSVSGVVVPERVYSRSAYESELLGGIYRDLAPMDPAGILRNEWVNARGCIARFDRMALEIRVLDVQECPLADLAVAAAVSAAVRALVDERWIGIGEVANWHEQELAALLGDVIVHGSATVIDNDKYLQAFGLSAKCTARELWQHIVESTLARSDHWPEFESALQVILGEGSLAERLLGAVGRDFTREQMVAAWRSLEHCLAEGRMFSSATA